MACPVDDKSPGADDVDSDSVGGDADTDADTESGDTDGADSETDDAADTAAPDPFDSDFPASHSGGDSGLVHDTDADSDHGESDKPPDSDPGGTGGGSDTTPDSQDTSPAWNLETAAPDTASDTALQAGPAIVFVDLSVDPDPIPSTETVATCSATALDRDGTVLPVTYTWLSDRGDALGAGDTLAVSTLSPGDRVRCVAEATRGRRSASAELETYVNRPPAIKADAATLLEGASVVISVLDNDQDLDGNLDPTLVSVGLQPAHGVATAQPDGTVLYVHDGSETTSDQLVYSARDTAGEGGEAKIYVVITPVNNAPDTEPDELHLDEGDWVFIDVLSNDTDPDGDIDPDTLYIVTHPDHGEVSIDDDGTVLYEHDATESASDSFTYSVADDKSAYSDPETVTLWISVSNDAPTITDIVDPAPFPVGGNSGPLAFMIMDEETAADDLIVNASSDNEVLVPNDEDHLSLTGTGAERELVVTPGPGEYGTATITVAVSDGEDVAWDAFRLTVVRSLVYDVWGTPRPVEYVLCGSGAFGDCDPTTAIASCTDRGMLLVTHAASVNTEGVLALGGEEACQFETSLFDIGYFVNGDPSAQRQCLVGVSNVSSSGCCDEGEWRGNIVDIPELGEQFGYIDHWDPDYQEGWFNGSGTTFDCTGTAPPYPHGSCTTYYVACAENEPPWVSAVMGPVTFDEDGASQPISFQVSDVETDAEHLDVTVTSEDESLVPGDSSHLILGGADQNRTLTVVSAPDAHGSTTITIEVSDRARSVSAAFAVVVNPIDDPPRVTNPGNQSHLEGALVNLAVTGWDLDGDALTWTATNLPGGTSIDASTGVIRGTLNTGSAGTYSTTVRATDPSFLYDEVAFTWTVSTGAGWMNLSSGTICTNYAAAGVTQVYCGPVRDSQAECLTYCSQVGGIIHFGNQTRDFVAWGSAAMIAFELCLGDTTCSSSSSEDSFWSNYSLAKQCLCSLGQRVACESSWRGVPGETPGYCFCYR